MKLVFATVAAALAGTTAFAGGYTPPVVEQPVIAPVEAPVDTGSDWTGGYVGLQYGQGDLDTDYPAETLPNGTVEPAESATFDLDAYGVHGGYLYDLGQFVVGGELDYNKLAFDDVEGATIDDGDLWRLRGRAGYDLGRWLPYASLGMAHMSVGDVSENGVSYGLGVDFKVTEKFTVGAEYSWQSWSDLDNVDNFDADLDLIQIRGSYHF